MASKGQSLTLTFVAWDTANSVGKTGDSANFTLRFVKDGVSGAPDNTPAEVDATNAPGVYSLVLTGTECNCNVGTLCGKSSTADVAIIPITITFEQLPTAAPDAAGGLPISDAGGLDLDTKLGYLTGATALEATAQSILTDTAEIGAAGTGLSAIPWNAAWDAEVESEVSDALAAYDPPTKAEQDAAFTEIKGATWSALTDTLEEIRDRGDTAWVTATGFSTLDAAGVRTAVGLASANLDTQLATLEASVDAVLEDTGTTLPGTLTVIAGYLDTEIASIKARTDNLPDSPAAVGSAMTLEAGAIADVTFTLPAESGPPTGVVGMLVWLAQRLGLRRVRKTASAIEVYAANATTVRTTNAYTSTGGVDDITAAGAP